MKTKTTALVGAAEIEAKYGVDRMQISRLIDAGDFPEPVANLAAGRVWDAEAVDKVVFDLRAEGRITSDGRIVPRRFLES
jgi:predicted DNA-binding transcriptional regulator AlpA